MRIRLSFVVACLLATVVWARAATPKTPSNVLVKPTFLLANGSWSGGTAFLLRLPGRPETMLVTCHHLFGPAAGLKRQMTNEEIARDVCGAIGLSMQDRKTIVVAQDYIGVPGARPVDNAGAENDLASFGVRSRDPVPSLELAENSPRVGESVYVFVRLRSDDQPRFLLATVTQVAEKWLLYSFEENTADLAGTSGAPVLNEAGQVVGMHVGGNQANGHQTGAANPAARIRELLKAPSK
jgi:hypothetical protein